MSTSNKAHHVQSMTVKRYLMLLLLVLASTIGDGVLSRGMKQIGEINASRWHELLFAVTNPWVTLGVFLLIVYFVSYMSALSWADLSYIMPATAFGNVLTALFAKYALNEQIPFTRWLGILLITFGVGFVARGPSLTVKTTSSGDELPVVPENSGS
jgi:uncharacterized membrane protein